MEKLLRVVLVIIVSVVFIGCLGDNKKSSTSSKKTTTPTTVSKKYTDMIYNEAKRQMREYHNLNEGFKIEISSRELTNLKQIRLDF